MGTTSYFIHCIREFIAKQMGYCVASGRSACTACYIFDSSGQCRTGSCCGWCIVYGINGYRKSTGRYQLVISAIRSGINVGEITRIHRRIVGIRHKSWRTQTCIACIVIGNRYLHCTVPIGSSTGIGREGNCQGLEARINFCLGCTLNHNRGRTQTAHGATSSTHRSNEAFIYPNGCNHGGCTMIVFISQDNVAIASGKVNRGRTFCTRYIGSGDAAGVIECRDKDWTLIRYHIVNTVGCRCRGAVGVKCIGRWYSGCTSQLIQHSTIGSRMCRIRQATRTCLTQTVIGNHLYRVIHIHIRGNYFSERYLQTT